MAEQLSYLFWQAPPDDALATEADADRLTTAEAVTKQARRLLADPRAHLMVTDFYEHWLHLGRLAGESRDPKAFPDFNEDVRKAMREGTRRLVEDVVFNGDGRVATLLTTTQAFINGALAPVYGLSSVPQGRDFAAQALPSEERAGLLTQPSFLTSETGPSDPDRYNLRTVTAYPSAVTRLCAWMRRRRCTKRSCSSSLKRPRWTERPDEVDPPSNSPAPQDPDRPALDIVSTHDQERSMYGRIGQFRAVPGERDNLIALLLQGIQGMPGCLSYVIATDPADANAIWITEVWTDEAHHRASLSLPAVQAVITRARPLIGGFGSSTITQPVGGHGLEGARQ